MRIEVEVVTGFLGYGKTSFINSLLKESQVKGEKVLIIQMEDGNKKIYEINDLNYPLKIYKSNDIGSFKKYCEDEFVSFKPNRIIIEFNGTDKIENFIESLGDREIRKIMKLSTVYFVADSTKLSNNIDTLGYYIIPFIKYSDMIIINNTEQIRNDELKKEINTLRKVNPKAFILNVDNKCNLSSRLQQSNVINNGCLKKFKVKLMNLSNGA